MPCGVAVSLYFIVASWASADALDRNDPNGAADTFAKALRHWFDLVCVGRCDDRVSLITGRPRPLQTASCRRSEECRAALESVRYAGGAEGKPSSSPAFS